jgi:hypothetical protein
MLSKTAWFKLLIVTIQNLRVSVRFRAQVRFKASKGTTYRHRFLVYNVMSICCQAPGSASADCIRVVCSGRDV